MTRDLTALVAKRILVFDGGLGTALDQAAKTECLTAEASCKEYLNLKHPRLVEEAHYRFLAAGADIVETNSFGGARHTLAEHGLAGRCYGINRRAALIARRAVSRFSDKNRLCFVAGSVGPGSKLPSLGHIGLRELVASYLPQIKGLLSGGADCLIIETCQDMLQAKAALIAAEDAFAAADRRVPVILQFTLDKNGRTLTGSDPATILATFEPLPVWTLGLNCGFGPDALAEPFRYLSEHSSKPVSLMPNAGLPRLHNGELIYDLAPEQFAAQMRQLAARPGLNLAGGCCGTTPEHIRLLAEEVRFCRPRRPARYVTCISSAFRSQPLAVRPKPLICGERTNATGSRRFREALLKHDIDGMVQMAIEQEKEGAHAIDLSLAAAGADERGNIALLSGKLNTALRLPVMIDSTDPQTVEAALSRLAGRCIVNSVNLSQPEKALRVMHLCRRYGAALVCMTIDQRGMAATATRKLAVARQLYRMATEEAGLSADSLFFDFLTFTLASGDQSLRKSAAETLQALKLARRNLPASRTLLGVSNVSHGLPPPVRRVLNSVFLHRAIQRGLDAAILHAGRVVPLSRIPSSQVRLCDNLIFDRRAQGRDPLSALLECFPAADASAARVSAAVPIDPAEQLRQLVTTGEKKGIEMLLGELLRDRSALEIINNCLLPAMHDVGCQFEQGKTLLPFVLRSAEVMAAAMDILQPHLKASRLHHHGKLLIATVQGDIHDIGKNLVDIIVSANGFRVVNLGIDQTPAQVLSAVKRHRPDAVGLSGLLVESARTMKDYLATFESAGIRLPVLLGGAALTSGFVSRELQPLYRGPVYYCQTALDGLRVMRRIASRRRAACR